MRVVTRDALSLDAAAAFSERTWLPTYSPSNQVWLDDIAERAAAAGADRLFHGASGSPACSYSHPMPLGTTSTSATGVRWRRWPGPMVGRGRDMAPIPVQGGGLLASPLRVRQRQRRASEFTTGLGFASADGDSTRAQLPDRSAYLKWLGQAFGTPAAMGPAGWPVAMLDPFTGRAILELAARMTPLGGAPADRATVATHGCSLRVAFRTRSACGAVRAARAGTRGINPQLTPAIPRRNRGATGFTDHRRMGVREPVAGAGSGVAVGQPSPEHLAEFFAVTVVSAWRHTAARCPASFGSWEDDGTTSRRRYSRPSTSSRGQTPLTS